MRKRSVFLMNSSSDFADLLIFILAHFPSFVFLGYRRKLLTSTFCPPLGQQQTPGKTTKSHILLVNTEQQNNLIIPLGVSRHENNNE